MNPCPGRLTASAVLAIARQHGQRRHCPQCAALKAPGWSSWPASVDEGLLQCLGALWQAGDPEPTLEECRPVGLDPWSPEVPISLAHHPANRCEVWACTRCEKPFLRYTEYGGYYVDRRFRELDPDKLMELAAPSA
jgi:hypothetical protein